MPLTYDLTAIPDYLELPDDQVRAVVMASAAVDLGVIAEDGREGDLSEWIVRLELLERVGLPILTRYEGGPDGFVPLTRRELWETVGRMTGLRTNIPTLPRHRWWAQLGKDVSRQLHHEVEVSIRLYETEPPPMPELKAGQTGPGGTPHRGSRA